MEKYRIKTSDNTWAAFVVPLFAFSVMNGDSVDYELQVRKGFWIFGHWETIHKTHSLEDIYIHLMNDFYNVKIPSHFECKYNKKHKWFDRYCTLCLRNNGNTYCAGYATDTGKYEEYCISRISFEDALLQLNKKLQNLNYKHDVEYKFVKSCSTFGDTF